MSGIFWEASQQPDLADSLVTFGTSSLSLALALPMCGLDLVCCLVLFAGSVLSMVLTPGIEMLGQAGHLALSTTGLEDSWSHNHTLVLCFFLYTITAHLLARTNGSSYQQLFSKLTAMATAILWIANFLLFPVFAKAQFTRLGLLSLGIQLGVICVRGLFQEQAGYRHNPPATPLDSIAGGFLGILRMEVMGAMVICAFGYPGSEGDKVPSYYCLVPFLAIQLIYFTSVLQTDAAVEVTANGHVTQIKEVVKAKIKEIKEVCGDKVTEVKEKIEDAVEKAIDENPEILEAAARVESAGQIIEDKIEEVVESVIETVEVIGEIVEETVEEIKEKVEEKIEKIKEIVDEKTEEVKADPLFQRLLAMLTSLYTTMAASMCHLLSPIYNLTTTAITKLSLVPWVSLLLLLTTTSSHLLHSAAWHHLTSSPLALALPLLTLALPLALTSLAAKLPASLPAYIEEWQTVGVAGLTYLLITATGEAGAAA